MKQLKALISHPQVVELEKKIADATKGLPHLPEGLTNFFVSIAPWLVIIGAILSVVFSPFAILGSFAVMALSPVAGIATLVSSVLSFIYGLILFMAFKPLKNREMDGFMLLFVGSLIGAVQTIVSIVASPSSIGSLVGIVIGMYFLFETKRHYK